jgi:hypothetical protein
MPSIAPRGIADDAARHAAFARDNPNLLACRLEQVRKKKCRLKHFLKVDGAFFGDLRLP